MSYCRFSSDDWKSDIYCFDHVNGGVTIYVAGNRHVGDTPIPALSGGDSNEFIKTHLAQAEWFETARIEPIGLPHDGEGYHGLDYGDAADKLRELRAAGYNVPQHAIDDLDEEAAPTTAEEE